MSSWRAVSTTPRLGLQTSVLMSSAVGSTHQHRGRSGALAGEALSTAHRAEAVLSTSAPDDIVTTNQRQAAIQEDKGVAYSKLSQDQQATLLALIEEYLSAQPQAQARQRLDKILQVGFDQIKFAWMGGLEKGEGHYYRVARQHISDRARQHAEQC